MLTILLWLLLVLSASATCAAADNNQKKSLQEHYLLLHPFYSGSHVLTLHSVSEELVKRGHKVTTVRFADQHNFTLKPLGSSHTEILLHVDNSNGSLPFLTKEAEAKFEMPMQLLWSDGLALSTLASLPGKTNY